MMKSLSRLEKPVLGYIVVSCALLAGMVAANASGQTRPNEAGKKSGTTQVSHTITPNDPVAELVRKRRWILGVQSDPTSTGYVVRRIEPQSAASRIGLEPGDRIVAVDGQQIGFVGTQLHSLSRTLELKGGHRGHVRLLVQDRRNRRLISLSVSLNRPLQPRGH